MFNIFSTLNQNLQNFGGDAYDAYQAGKSKVGNVASTINTNLQNFGGDIYDAGQTIKKNVSDFGKQTYNQGKNVASTIKKNVGDYATGQINEIKAIPGQIGSGIDAFQQGARDLNYKAWNAGMKGLTGQNNSTFSDIAPQIKESLSQKTGDYDKEKMIAIIDDMQKQGLNEAQITETIDEINRQDPNFLRTSSYGDKIRGSALKFGQDIASNYNRFDKGQQTLAESGIQAAGSVLGLGGGIIGNTLTEVPGVEYALGKVGQAVTAIPGVKPGMEAYGEFAKAHPRAAANIGAATNIGLTAIGSTQGQQLVGKGLEKAGQGIKKGASYIDDVTSPLTTPISNAVSQGTSKLKSAIKPSNIETKLASDVGLKTTKGLIGDKVVDVPTYSLKEKGLGVLEPADTKRLVNRALSPRGTGLSDKQRLASVVNAEKNVRNYHNLVRSGKLKGDLSSLESTAQSVVDNLDEVGAKIGKSVDSVKANVSISNDAYKAIDDAINARGAARTPTAKVLSNFKEDTSGSMSLKEAFDIKKIYQTEVGKLLRSGDAGTPQYSALVKGVDELTNQIDNAIETGLKGNKFKELKSQYKLMKSMVSDITNSAMVEGRRSPQTFVEQLGTIESIADAYISPISTAKKFLAKEIGEMNTRGGSWKSLIKRLDNEAVNAYKKSQTITGKVMQREMENLPVATKPPIVPKAKPKATTESALKTTPIAPEKKSIVAKKEVVPKEVKTDTSSVPMPKQLMDIIKTSKNQDDMVSKLREASNNSYEFRDAITAYEKSGGKDMTYAELFGMKKSLTATPKESAFKNNKGFINPSEIKKSLIPKKGVDEARQFYDDLVYAGNSPIVAQRETAKRFGTIRAMSASKAGTMDIGKAPEALIQEARKYKSADDFIKAQGEPLYHGTDAVFDKFDINKSGEKGIAIGKGINLAEKRQEAEFYSKNKNTMKVFLDKDIKIKSFKDKTDFVQQRKKSGFNSTDNSNKGINKDIENYSKYLLEQGYDGIMIPENTNYRMRAGGGAEYGKNFTIINPSKVKTESQLKQIYEQANKPKFVPNKK